MPTIAHLVLGAVIGVCLYYISDGKFSKTHVFVLFLNNYLGPDIGWVLGLGTITHSIAFWPVFAFVLSYFYHYFTRFTIEIKGFKNVELIDLEKHKMSYINVYFLVVAGGTLHNYIDSMMNRGGIFYIVPEISSFSGISWTVDDFMQLWETGLLGNIPVVSLLIGILLILGFIFLFVWYLKNISKKAGLITLSYVMLFMLTYLLLGSLSTEHADAGAIVYISLFWAIPLACCVLSTREFKYLKKTTEKTREKKNKNLTLITLWLFLVGSLGGIAMILGFSLNNAIITFIFDNYGAEMPSYLGSGEILAIALILESLILTLSFISLACAIGLKTKNEKIWRFTIYCHLILSWTIIGLYIACALSDKQVKETIENKV